MAGYLWSNRAVLCVIVLTGILHSISGFLLTISVGDFFSGYYQAGGSKGRLMGLIGIHLPTTAFFFAFFFGLLFVKAILGFAEARLTFRQGELFVKEIREKLFVSQMSQPEEVFSKKGYGNYLLRYSSDMKPVSNYLSLGILGAVKNIFFLLTGIFLLACIHWLMALCLISLFALGAFGFMKLANRQRKFILASRSGKSGLLAFVTKSFSRFSKIKQEEGFTHTISRFKLKSDSLSRANLVNYQYESLVQSLIPAMQYAILGLLLFFSTLLTPAISYSDALIFVLVTMQLFPAMRKLLKVPSVINKGRLSLEKMEMITAATSPGDVTPAGRLTAVI